MRTFLKVVLVSIVAAFTFTATLIAVSLLASTSDLAPGMVGPWATTAVLVAMLGLPIGTTFFVGRALARRIFPLASRPVFSRPACYAIALAYVITAVFAVPACQTFRSQWAVAEYKRLKASGDLRVWETHPHIAAYAALPILPGVVLEYHEYQLDGLYGFGGFELFVWYGAGVRSVGQLPLWVS